jgi:hypothetical protein
MLFGIIIGWIKMIYEYDSFVFQGRQLNSIPDLLFAKQPL